MKNNITEMVFILDKSGSMSGLERDTIGGFNSMINNQKKKEGRAYVSTVLFSDSSTVVHDRADISEIRPMTEEDYCPGGCTALIDAIGSAVKHIKNIHKYARPEDVPENTIFIITTDGMENASHVFSSDEVKKMIEQQKEVGWEFLFVAANIDAVDTAAHIGISSDRAVNYYADSCGTEAVYDCLCDSISEVRAGKALSKNWSRKIDSDFKKRKKK